MLYLPKWDDLPESLKNDSVYSYYIELKEKKSSIFFKRIFDIIFSFILLVILAIPMLVIAVMIKIDSKGPIFFRQVRITNFGKEFRIHKFRTMRINSEINGQLTVGSDSRITKVGALLRDKRIDELPQLIDILMGNMSFVGTRPEVVKYVDSYNDEMMATLLLPAGVTSEASIRFKDEAKILENSCNKSIDECYIERVLPEKMRINLEYLRKFNFANDVKIISSTIKSVLFN